MRLHGASQCGYMERGNAVDMARRNAFAVDPQRLQCVVALHLQRLQRVAAWHQLEFLICGLGSSNTATTSCHDTTNPTHSLLHEGPLCA